MRTLQRAQVHRLHGMPSSVAVWIEPTDEDWADVYVNASLYTAEEAQMLEVQLNTA